MSLEIYFETEAMMQELTVQLIDETNICLEQFMKEALSGLSAKAKAASETEEALLEAGSHIIAVGKFYADAIIESFGKGSKADTSSPYWDEYMSSSLWNPARKSATIVGRPAGTYTNLWGKTSKSSGKFEGVNIEKWARPRAALRKIQSAEDRANFKAVKNAGGTRSIQNAEAWIAGKQDTWIEQRLKRRATTWIAANGNKFFHN